MENGCEAHEDRTDAAAERDFLRVINFGDARVIPCTSAEERHRISDF